MNVDKLNQMRLLHGDVIVVSHNGGRNLGYFSGMLTDDETLRFSANDVFYEIPLESVILIERYKPAK